MKTITKEYKVYLYEELSEEAQARALSDYNENNEYPFLQCDLREYIHDELAEAGYSHGEITPLYSLSHCQGDGLMFTGSVINKDKSYFEIKHAGHYYHERSTDITGYNKDGSIMDGETVEKWENDFYIPLCIRIRDRGYREIEYQQSAELFAETCEANEYTFLEEGKMFNE